MLIVGVGGQGVLTVARLLGEAAMAAGLPVCVGQQHGMSQRGGSVEATVVIGAAVRTPLVGPGEADLLVALEPLEALRAVDRLAPDAVVVVSHAGVPLASRPSEPYPALPGILDALRAGAPRVVDLDAAALARQAGSPRALGAVMLGAVARIDALPFDAPTLEATLLRGASAVQRPAALAAFRLGFGAYVV